MSDIVSNVTDFDNEQKFTSASYSSYYQMCISKRQKSDIIINIIRQPEPVSWFETISLIRTCSN